MIYIFKGPCAFCKNFAAFKREIGCRKPPITQKPLNTFLLVQGCLGLNALYWCLAARKYQDTECRDGDPDVLLGFETFLQIVTAFSFVSLLFAAYAFVRVWKKILRLSGTPGFEPSELPPPDDMKYKKIRIPLATVRAAAKEVFKYDLIVLGYFLCSLCVAVLCLMAPNSITHAADCPHAQEVRSVGMTFLWADALYAPTWWFCCPNRKGVVAEIPWQEGEKAPPPA